MIGRAAALAAAILVATPAAAEDGVIRVGLGQKVTVAITPDGRPGATTVEAVSEAEAAPPRPGQGRFADPPEGTLVLILGREGDRLHLKLESGVSRAFDYRGELITGGRRTPARVCTALPLMANYEQWPAGAEAVEISQLRFRATNEVTCSPPEGGP